MNSAVDDFGGVAALFEETRPFDLPITATSFSSNEQADNRRFLPSEGAPLGPALFAAALPELTPVASASTTATLPGSAFDRSPGLPHTESFLNLNPFARDDSPSPPPVPLAAQLYPVSYSYSSSPPSFPASPNPPAASLPRSIVRVASPDSAFSVHALLPGRSNDSAVGLTLSPTLSAQLDWGALMDPWSPVFPTTSSSTPSIKQGASADLDPAAEFWKGLQLGDNDVSSVYDIAFNTALPQNGRVALTNVRQVLTLSSLAESHLSRIFRIVQQIRLGESATHPNAQSTDAETINRYEFNIVLALAAMAQKNMALTTDNLVAHRHDLPKPNLPEIETFIVRSVVSRSASRPLLAKPRTRLSRFGDWYRGRGTASQDNLSTMASTEPVLEPPPPPAAVTAPRSGGTIESSPRDSPSYPSLVSRFNADTLIVNDPWKAAATSSTNTAPQSQPPRVFSLSRKSSSSFLTIRKVNSSSHLSAVKSRNPIFSNPGGQPSNMPASWTGETPSADGAPGADRNGLRAALSSTEEEDVGGGAMSQISAQFSRLELNPVQVSVNEEKGGSLFKYVNYILSWEARKTNVLRRFSDFWWLLEVFHKKYPYRMLPTLPPKSLASSDDKFLEKRRRGLSRFICFLVRHPVLSRDQLLTDFLTFEEQSHSVQTQFRNTCTSLENHAKINFCAFQDYLKRYLDISFALREVLNRRNVHSFTPQIEKVAQRLRVSNEKLAKLKKGGAAEAGPNDPEQTHLNASLSSDEALLRHLTTQSKVIESCVWAEYCLYHDSRSFMTWLYSKYARDQINHHSLMLNSWRQSLLELNHAADSP
ncbi:Sorting nexin mvp1 [Dimargaris cristalligena]|nr:Sorting nexin mvp1 [Dimargaris cristalligena]